MRVSYFDNVKYGKEFGGTGDPLVVHELKTVINWLPNLPKDHAKHMVGIIYFHTNDKVGTKFNPVSNGIMGVDIDNIPKEDCKKIMEAWDKLVLAFPCLVCAWYTHSFYNKERGGLRLVIKTENELRHEDFINNPKLSYRHQNTIYTAALVYHIYKICGIDVRPTKIEGKTTGIDRAMLKIGQPCFLNYSETVKWNDSVLRVDITDEAVSQLKSWFTGYNWFSNENDYEIVSCEVKSFKWEKIFSTDFKLNTTAFDIDNQLGHDRRIAVENFLAGLGWEFDDIVNFMKKICFGKDYRDGEYKLFSAIKQTTRTAISKFRDKPSAFYASQAKYILTALGIDIDIEIKKRLTDDAIERRMDVSDQTINIYFDPVFEEVWDAEKDKPFYNKYYNPENLLKIHLEENEFIGDYSLEINEFVYKYPAIYLKGDAGDGKTTHALNSSFNSQLFKNEFVLLMQGDSIDLCVPYNSVADNKAKSEREDIQRVMTANVKDFSDNKRNVFIWNTIMPLYEQYYKSGVVKRMVLFFDESHKIVTDDFRWRTVFELFKALPTMYKHFVFMTGTPAYEHEFLLQYFPNMGFINVTKKSKYKKTCNILKYPSFGVGDMVELIKNHINNNKLPLVYSNYRNSKWKHALDVINKERITEGETPLRILDYSRPNALNDEVKKTNELNSIKEFDVVIGTKYLSVGIDFVKDDDRMRVPIVDYAGERDCTSLDIWQFQARNREQNVEIEIIALDNEDYYKKLYNLQFYKQLFLDMAKVHTHSLIIDIDNESEEIKDEWSFMLKLYNERKFGRYEIEERKVDGKKVVTNWFKDQKNVTLLGLYYRYVKLFSNMNMIKAMLSQRGVTITETQMSHIKAEIEDDTIKHEVFQFFIDNWNEISDIICCLGQYDEKCYKIDINRTDKEHITDGKIWGRDTKYMSWLIKNFAGKDEWKKILEEHGFINSNYFAKFNRAKRISKVLTKKNIEKIKRFMSKDRTEKAITDFALTLLESHYEKLNLDYNCLSDRLKMQDVIDDYTNILEFIITHIEFIEQLKNAENDAEGFTVFAKMQMVMEMELQEKKNKKNSDSHKQQITVVWEDDMTEQSFESICALAKEVGYSKGTISKILSGKQNNHKRKFIVKNS